MSKSQYYDTYLREKVDNPIHYDRMIDLIMAYNPHCKDVDWATNTVNMCIRGVNADCRDYATGGCMALYSRGGKVRLFLEPLEDICLSMAMTHS